MQQQREDVIDSGEHDAFAHSMATLLLLLIQWQRQPPLPLACRARIASMRNKITRALRESPHLRTKLEDAGWRQMVWTKATAGAARDTGLPFPETCPWGIRHQVLSHEWLPE